MEMLRWFSREGSFLKRALRVAISSSGLASEDACLAFNSSSQSVFLKASASHHVKRYFMRKGS